MLVTVFRPRVIPVLLLDGQALVKTVRFAAGQYIGDPLNAVKLFNDLRVDELVFLDISASRQKRMISTALIAQIGGEANMPFAVGGGIRTLQQIRSAIAAGAEKVVINDAALLDPGFVRSAADTFGSSTIAVCLDVKRAMFAGRRVFSHCLKKSSGRDPVEYARAIEALGAGELVVQSVDRDGMMDGYDIALIKAVSEAVSIPVVALGGAGDLTDLASAYFDGFASAVAAGSLFVYQSRKRGVLINYPSPDKIKNVFMREGS
jgi:imidazole glycerol-phosphate synthase subunit HisF